MPRYQLAFSRSAKKELDKLDRVTRQRIAKKLLYFLEQDDPLIYARQLIHASLGGYQFRVGHYRIVFDVHVDTLQVLRIKHRREVYRR